MSVYFPKKPLFLCALPPQTCKLKSTFGNLSIISFNISAAHIVSSTFSVHTGSSN